MKICIFGSASEKIDESFKKETEMLSIKLAQHGHDLVFGGGAAGVMGAAAKAFAANGREIIGVAPLFFSGDGILFNHCTTLIRTRTLHERKRRMERLSDVFIVAPGGVGTMDEFFEVFTLKNLGRHRKPVIVFSVNGCYDRLFSFLDDLVRNNLVRAEAPELLSVVKTPEEALKIIDGIPAL